MSDHPDIRHPLVRLLPDDWRFLYDGPCDTHVFLHHDGLWIEAPTRVLWRGKADLIAADHDWDAIALALCAGRETGLTGRCKLTGHREADQPAQYVLERVP